MQDKGKTFSNLIDTEILIWLEVLSMEGTKYKETFFKNMWISFHSPEAKPGELWVSLHLQAPVFKYQRLANISFHFFCSRRWNTAFAFFLKIFSSYRG